MAHILYVRGINLDRSTQHQHHSSEGLWRGELEGNQAGICAAHGIALLPAGLARGFWSTWEFWIKRVVELFWSDETAHNCVVCAESGKSFLHQRKRKHASRRSNGLGQLCSGAPAAPGIMSWTCLPMHNP